MKFTCKEDCFKVTPVYVQPQTYFVPTGSGVSGQTLTTNGSIQWITLPSSQPRGIYTSSQVDHYEVEISDELLEQLTKYIFGQNSKDTMKKLLND
jgi:hypothetical protein